MSKVINTNKVTFAAFAVTMAAALAMAVVPGLMTSASAKIQEVDISCSNPAGNEPGGQQPSCQNEALTQESENQNPSGAAPPGQNK